MIPTPLHGIPVRVLQALVCWSMSAAVVAEVQQIYQGVGTDGEASFSGARVPGSIAIYIDVHIPTEEETDTARARADAMVMIANDLDGGRVTRWRTHRTVKRSRARVAPVRVEYRYPYGHYHGRSAYHTYPYRPAHPHRRSHGKRQSAERFIDELSVFAPPPFARPAYRPPQRARRAAPGRVTPLRSGFGSTGD